MWNRSQPLFLLMVLLVTGAGTPAWTQEKLSVRVDLWSGGTVSINKIPFVVAQEEGIYERNGLDVDQYPFSSAGIVMELTYRAWSNLFNSWFNRPRQTLPYFGPPAPIRIGGGTPRVHHRVTDARVPDWIIFATTDHVFQSKIIARPEITSLEQLKGKRLGYNVVGSTTHFMALVLAEKMGWDPVQDISLMAGGSLEKLQEGSLDAFIASDFRKADALAAGYKVLFDIRTWNVPIAGSSVNAPASWLRDNRETARRFIKSLVEAIALMKQDKNVVFRAYEKGWGITDPEKLELMYAGGTEMPRKPYPAVEGIKKTMEIYDSNEMRKYKPEDFYDDSFVRELDESGFIDSLYK